MIRLKNVVYEMVAICQMNDDWVWLRPVRGVGVILIDEVKGRFNCYAKVRAKVALISRTPNGKER